MTTTSPSLSPPRAASSQGTLALLREELRPALRAFALLTVLAGIVYPAVVTAIARTAFPQASVGSLVHRQPGEAAAGSSLLGQKFTAPYYFHGRPSVIDYNPASSSGSNLAPTNPALIDSVTSRALALRRLRGSAEPSPAVPIDLVTASGSGLDPEITEAGALWQAVAVARARGLDLAAVQQLIRREADRRIAGIVAPRRVNVLALNMALDEIAPVGKKSGS